MKMLLTRISILLLAAVFVLPSGPAIAEDGKKAFSQQELDQMMAPIALYPDSLLSQILMASTYPADVAEAVKWSKENPDKKGDDAVKAVQTKSWDPSVMSLVAFPSVLDMMGQKPDWVQTLGDAFLANPDGVMDTAQSLRKKAKDEGNLETSKEQTVKVEDESGQQIIVIEPGNPSVVYVPTYNPTVIYGTWWWPSYTPYYYRPVGYGFGAGVVTGIGFGIGIGITNALWGNCNWRNNRVDIDVNRFNNINIDRNKLDASGKRSTWQHNASNRSTAARRDISASKNNLDKTKAADARNEYRGRDADRQKAQAALESRGIDPAKGREELQGSAGAKARDSVKQADRGFDSSKVNNIDKANLPAVDKGKLSNVDKGNLSSIDKGNLSSMDKSKVSGLDSSSMKSKARSNASYGDYALSNAGNARSTQSHINRGTTSNRSFQGSGGFSRGGGGGGMSRGGGRRR